MTTPSLLTGWGRTAPSAAHLVRPSGPEEIEGLVSSAGGGRGLSVRGLGRSYGDAAQCAGGTVIETTALDHVSGPDASGLVRAGPGVSIDTLMRTFVPQGWFVPVTPGTRQVTVGGAVAADIHGKNHHRDGALCSHVRELTLVTPSGTKVIGPDAEAELFWATAGGMGLTGVVTEAAIEMVPIESAFMVVDTERAGDLDDAMAKMTGGDDGYRYSVAWIDCLSSGSRLGRAVLTRGDHARAQDLDHRRRSRALEFHPRPGPTVPFTAPSGLLNPLTVAAFNELWYRKAPRRRLGEIQPIGQFFHPLDGVNDWNLLYGRHGFLQYQFVVPTDADGTVRRILERLARARVASFLAVLKRFGPADPGPLSFPIPGWTLSLDIPLAGDVGPLLDDLDDLVAQAGGRVYLAKDSRLRPELLEVMYPRLGEWRALRDSVDPSRTMASDLARRLGLLGPAAPGPANPKRPARRPRPAQRAESR